MDQLIAPAVFLPIIARSALPPLCPRWLKFLVTFVLTSVFSSFTSWLNSYFKSAKSAYKFLFFSVLDSHKFLLYLSLLKASIFL